MFHINYKKVQYQEVGEISTKQLSKKLVKSKITNCSKRRTVHVYSIDNIPKSSQINIKVIIINIKGFIVKKTK